MKFTCEIELTGNDQLLEQHNIVTLCATKNGVEVDRFNATVEQLVDVDFFNTRFNDHTAYLKIKSLLAKSRQ